ncbi:MAG TPA: hypothetical protein VFD50_08150 [Thermoleophilia bacterium]|nr:hypothetical protein [Thermoleophilia bacterium]
MAGETGAADGAGDGSAEAGPTDEAGAATGATAAAVAGAASGAGDRTGEVLSRTPQPLSSSVQAAARTAPVAPLRMRVLSPPSRGRHMGVRQRKANLIEALG